MNRIKYYAEELNTICIAICLIIVVNYWIQELSPELYAFIQVLIETLSSTYSIKGIDTATPVDFVNELL